MLVEKFNLGFGMCFWCYVMIVNDCEIEKIFVELGFSDNYVEDLFEVFDVDIVLVFFKGIEVLKEKLIRLEFVG